MQNNQSLLVSKVFRAKYTNSWFENNKRGKIPQSSSWGGGRSIMKSVDLTREGLGKRVINGKTTKILDNIWAGGRKNLFKENMLNSTEIKPMWVSDLIMESNNWNSNLLQKWFKEEDVNMIKTIHVPSLKTENEVTWEETRHGNYKLCSGYWCLTREFCPIQDTSNF